MTNRFNEIRFGYASAEVEAVRNPSLLLEAYYDRTGLINRLIEGHEYLVLGPKGSGKTAIGERLRLIAESDPMLFVSNTYLSDFPYIAFKRVAAGDIEPESKFPTAWAYLVLLRVLDSLIGDAGAHSSLGNDFNRGTDGLRRLGALPARDLKALVMTSSKKSFKAQIPKIIEGTVERTFSGQDLAIVQLVEFLWRLIGSISTDSKHIVVIDGLDDILTRTEVQYQALAALVLEVSRINERLASLHANAKVLLLMRTDLYERIPGTNKNKWRRDSSITLDWYNGTPQESPLLELVRLRASLASGRALDVFSEFFPERLSGSAAVSHLLNETRHLPRDMIALLSCIQDFVDAQVGGRLSPYQVLRGVRSYSIEYFLPEVKDSLVGFAEADQIESIFGAISSLRSRYFNYSQIMEEATSVGTLGPKDVRFLLYRLYECSALGTLHSANGMIFDTFKYTAPHSTLGLGNQLLLHRGLWHAMGVK